MSYSAAFMLGSRIVLGAVLALPTAQAFATEGDRAPRRRPLARPIITETTGTTPVDLRVGPHRFRIPHGYFRHPPHPSGVDVAFGLRALLPDMEPITEANRHVLRMPFSTEEGRRVVSLVFEVMPDRPRDDARWRAGNLLRGRDATLDDFEPASERTHRLRTLRGQPVGTAGARERDLYWGELRGDRQFVSLACYVPPKDRPEDRLTDCQLWLDWRGRPVTVSHDRRSLPQWREIAAAALALMDRLAVKDDGELDGVGR